MKTKIIEATQDARGGMSNWGKFMLGRMTGEWAVRSGLYEVARSITTEVTGDPTAWQEPAHSPGPLLRQLGWDAHHLWVMDLQTGEGVLVRPGGSAHADLQKHAVWVCPLFEPFLEWLYRQDLDDLDALPTLVELPEAPFDMAGYRRPRRVE